MFGSSRWMSTFKPRLRIVEDTCCRRVYSNRIRLGGRQEKKSSRSPLLHAHSREILTPEDMSFSVITWSSDSGVSMKSNGASREDALSPQAALAHRLNLLLDVVVAERGSPVTFREIEAGLRARGIKISRARWFYMKDGTGRLVSDPQLLAAICEMFDVDPSYLLNDVEGDIPERIDSQLEFVKSLRAARVKSFAARTLGDVSPETLRAISEYLNKDIDLHPNGERAAATPPRHTGDERPATP